MFVGNWCLYNQNDFKNWKYLLYEELPSFERFANWHYDLEVNLPGLEIIHHLLEKIENLQLENRKLYPFSPFDDEH